MKPRKKATKKRVRRIISNFILYWTSREKEREQMHETLEEYLETLEEEEK